MELKDFPRPPKDTGIGMHWSPGNAGAVGAGELRNTWIPQLQRMGVKWVKLLHQGGVEFAELLLAADIMPVVRIYRHRPNATDLSKAVLGPDEIAAIKAHLAVGVRYFEFNNEPELASEWEGGESPPDAIDYVARAAIVDMETILGLGGYPAVPATAVGAKWDLIGKIIEHGGDYLFDEPVWLALHNYDINHPLDYPYDRINRRGETLSPEAYRSMGTDAWTGSRWGLRTLAFINEQRKTGKNPRADIHKDPSGFLAFQRLADLSMKHLGKHLPILSTENGPIVGEDDDPRYPTTTPESHAEKVAAMAKIMMGTSHRYDAAPDYYFCTAFWLMGAAVLKTKGWEGHAWFSQRWPDGRLPAVDALEQLPKRPRRFTYDEDERPVIPIIDSRSHSVVSGVIHGFPNMRVILRSAAYATDAYTDDAGRFRIQNLPAGSYRLSVPGAEIVRLGIELDGKNHVELTIGEPEPSPEPVEPESPTGWRVQVEDAGPAPGLSLIRVSVEGQSDLPVRIFADGWEGFSRNTGSKPEFGPYALEFSPLGPGQYVIEPEGLGAQARVKLEESQALMVTFHLVRQEETPEGETEAREGGVIGRIANGAGLRVLLRDPDGLQLEMIADEDGAFSFAELKAGVYELILPDLDISREVKVDGRAIITLNLEAPAVETPQYSTISGRVMNGAGRIVMLKGPKVHQETEVGADEHYLFDQLGPGQYYVRVKDTLLRRGGLKMTGRNHRQVNFAIPAIEPKESVLYGMIPGGAHWQVYVRGPQDMEIVQPLDEEGRFEITDLKAGDYEVILQSPDADYIEHITLDGREKVEVAFQIAASGPAHVVEDLAEGEGEGGGSESTPAGWTWQVEEIGPGPGFGVVRVRIPGRAGLAVRLWADGWTGMARRIGDKPEFGPDVCEFAPLGTGDYYLQPEGVAEPIQVAVPGSREIWVTFAAGNGATPQAPSDLPTPSAQKEIPLFILVRSMPFDLPGFIGSLHFAAQTPAPFGDDIEDALRAEKVIVLANSDDFSDEEKTRLEQAGCQVIQVAPPYYATTLPSPDN